MDSPGKVLIIVENLPVPFDRRVWMEAVTLKEAGHEVSVICPTAKNHEKHYELVEDIHIYRHPLPEEISSSSGYLREYFWALRWEFQLARRIRREHGFDVIHICNPPDLLFLVAGWFKLFHRARVIYDQHDLNPEMYEAKFNRRDLFYYGLRIAERLSFMTADVVIATNESHRKVALTRGKKNDEQVFVVRSAPDLKRFQPVPANPVYRTGYAYLVGYLGVMGEAEGIDRLLYAIHHIVHELQRRDIRFMLVGSGPAANDLKALSQTLGLTEYIEFTGRIPDKELIERISSCDVCVNPDPKTPYNDLSTMNKILEYMALGKPIVQFDVIEGRLSAEDASLYAKADDEIDFAHKILELLEDPQQRQRMGERGRARMEEILEWRHQKSKLLQAYSRVIQVAGGKTPKGRNAAPIE
jgi:glycosyltransferase involved in cell wall biosynthesis